MYLKRKILTMVLILAVLISSFTKLQIDSQAATSIKIGDYIQFASYYDEPICWRIINIDEDGDPLLYAKDILCLKAFDANGDKYTTPERIQGGSNEWEYSTLRQWLNSDKEKINWINNPPIASNFFWGENEINSYDQEKGFLAEGNFTADERNAVKTVTNKVLLSWVDKHKRDGGIEEFVINNKSTNSIDIAAAVSNYDRAYYKNITERVFLLSVKELDEYMYSRGWEFRAKPTMKAVENFQTRNEQDSLYKTEYWMYWLRTPNPLNRPYPDFLLTLILPDKVSRVISDGSISFHSATADNERTGVRPALYLDLTSISFESGVGTESSPYIAIGKDSSKPSSWSESEIEKGKEHNLLPEKILSNYQRNINREEFCELAVKLYETISGKKVAISNVNKFKDTNNPEVLKAYALGIVNGISDTEFAPVDKVTREQLSVMLNNLLNALDAQTNVSMEYVYFSDEAEISTWAKNSIQLMNKMEILNGVGNQRIDPKGKTSREEAIVLAVRLYEKLIQNI